jgi:hypothetical protein
MHVKFNWILRTQSRKSVFSLRFACPCNSKKCSALNVANDVNVFPYLEKHEKLSYMRMNDARNCVIDLKSGKKVVASPTRLLHVCVGGLTALM